MIASDKNPDVARGVRDLTKEVVPSEGQRLLGHLQKQAIVLDEDWENLSPPAQEEITNCLTTEELLPKLVAHGLLTEYQAGRFEAGTLYGLMLGHYRVLDRIGAGGMGVVFKAEHVDMRRLVAIKVLPMDKDMENVVLRRFYTEIRAVAQLQHPNIVAALDAGKCPALDGNSPTLHFFVMEYVPGQDLEEYVIARGPLSPVEACDFAHQIAAALMEAHKHQLVHRDIKPSNIRITPDGRAKLLDFGLARQLSNRLTQPGTVLGTMDYMSPEQASDAASVDIRADIYGLGGTLFLCLTGKIPFPPKETFMALPFLGASRGENRPERGGGVANRFDRLAHRLGCQVQVQNQSRP